MISAKEWASRFWKPYFATVTHCMKSASQLSCFSHLQIRDGDTGILDHL